MIQSAQLRTSKGLANARTFTTNAYEALFSYETLVGVKTATGSYIQRSGKAASKTTARHISQWLAEYGLTPKAAAMVADENALQTILEEC